MRTQHGHVVRLFFIVQCNGVILILYCTHCCEKPGLRVNDAVTFHTTAHVESAWPTLHRLLEPLFSLPPLHLSDSERKNVNTSIFFMSSTGQITSSTSNIQLIIDAALADYTKITGTDLSKTPFAAAIERSNSPEAILQLLQERENAFKEHREGNRRLINCLSPAVSLIQAFSGILGEAVSLVSHRCHPVTQINSDLIRSPSHQQTLCLLASILSLLYVLSIRF